MKNFCRILGIIALVAIIGFSMAACGDDDGPGGGPGGYGPGGGGGGGGGSSANLTGTWEDNALGGNRYVFTAYSYTYHFMSWVTDEGTYTVNGSTVRFTSNGGISYTQGETYEARIINSTTIQFTSGNQITLYKK